MIADSSGCGSLSPPRSGRGVALADRSALSRTVVALGRISLDNDQIEAIDVNPLLLQENGTSVAVDASIWIPQ